MANTIRKIICSGHAPIDETGSLWTKDPQVVHTDITTNCYYYRFDNGFCERYIIACPTQVIRQENCDEDCNCETFILKKSQ